MTLGSLWTHNLICKAVLSLAGCMPKRITEFIGCLKITKQNDFVQFMLLSTWYFWDINLKLFLI